MSTRHRHVALSAALVAAALVGCSTVGDAPALQPLDGTHWRLIMLRGVDEVGRRPITLSIDGSRASGSDGCNRYTVSIEVSGPDLRFAGRPEGTLMACPDALQRSADAYRRALPEVRAYRVRDAGRSGTLELLDASGQVLAALAAQSQSLGGTAWDVTAVNNGRGAVVSLVPGTRVTLSFGDEGRVSGHAGCNRFMSRFEQSSQGLRIDPPSSTRMSCPQEGVMGQEQAALLAIAAARKVRIEGDLLELRAADDTLLLSGQAAAMRR